MNIQVIETQLRNARARVAALEAKFDQARLIELKKVEITKKGETVTLTFGGRVIKAKKPALFNDRYNLTENGKKIATGYGGINDIRFAIAMGKI